MAQSSTNAEIAVTIVGGYLGAGKTTLVNHLLRSSGERIGVLVNDFGEINIDADLIESNDGDTITLANGCICCSLVDGFASALESVTSAETPPGRLLIEASGVSDPASVAAWAHRPGLRLDGVVVVVDLENVRGQAADEYIGDTVLQQLGTADVLIGSKADLVSPNDLGQTRVWLAAKSQAPMLEADHSAVDPRVVFGIGSGEVLVAPSGERADEHYRTWSREWPEPLDRDEFDSLIESLSAGTIRVKGIVRFADEPDERVIVQRVRTRMTCTADGPWRSGPSMIVGIELR